MTTTYTIAIDADDDGSFSMEITPDVIAMRWRLGMAAARDNMAAPIHAEITLRGADDAYAPEFSGLLPGKRLVIRSTHANTTRTHFTGYVGRVEPAPGDHGVGTAVLHVHGPLHWLRQNIVRLPPQASVSARALIQQIIRSSTLRYPVLAGYLILGAHPDALPGRKLFGEALNLTGDEGQSRFDYVGALWGDGLAASDAIREIVAAERGRFAIDRSGDALFLDRHHLLARGDLSATFNNAMTGLHYGYGAQLVSRVQVRMWPRSIGTSGATLWRLAEPQRLRQRSERVLIARYRTETGDPLAALNVAAPLRGLDFRANRQPDGSGQNVTASVRVRLIEAGTSAARLLVNNDDAFACYLTALRLRGTPLHIDDTVTLEQRDPFSETYFGQNRLQLDLPALADSDAAENIARAELVRYKRPRGLVDWLETDTHAHPTAALALTLFDRIRIEEARTHHAADYFIVAEAHEVDQGGARHRVRWTLEPADDDRFMVLGRGRLDGRYHPAY